MNVIAISNQKGGCGKTTTAINLSAALARDGKKTLLIDLDPQAHATFGLGIRQDSLAGTIYNVLTESTDKKQKFLENVIIPIDENFDLAPSHILLSTIEQEFMSKDESVSRLYHVLQTLSFPYDTVVIDCPPSLGFLTFNALRAAQAVIVPVELSSFSLMGVDKLLSMIELIRVKMQYTPKVFALATLVDKRSNFSRHMIEEIRQTFGEHVFENVIHQSVAVRESQAKGVSIWRHNPKAKAAMDYQLLAQEVTDKIFTNHTLYSTSTSDRFMQIEEGPLRDFTFKGRTAKEVHLVGDFNGWQVSSESLLWQKEEGLWQKRVFLGPGRYRYKFVVDGQWMNDPSNDQFESNPYGDVDSVIEI